MLRRPRVIAVLGFLLAGAIGIVSSTQTWISVSMTDAGDPLLVAGADAVSLLAPLSLAVLALGAALSIAGRVLRYVIGALGAIAAGVLITSTLPVVTAPPISAVAAALTDATGISGDRTLASIVTALDPTAWPVTALITWGVLAAASVFTLATAHRWRAGGRRYRQGGDARGSEGGPLDAVDSWDDLSHGTDPTGPSR
ncbi:Trp biosynthesis-associated membrane protein [Microbacterium sp. NPDC058342]|uniref:Trp biosynthesis-associated membrane protein n=1 Tax=Microbacterium sp. NPDC058342 TaxID=3346454 RepID=UPI003661145D